ncbi:hypothetical protein ILYODFUR_003237 [Ilyodon furcidens]|uniref:Uncharacterized protein n=1 Tax=Ilyodon furcidens TaxID=33524 RepID=A0ABV0TFM4_9TELE
MITTERISRWDPQNQTLPALDPVGAATPVGAEKIWHRVRSIGMSYRRNHPISMPVLRANRARRPGAQNSAGLGHLDVNIIDWLMMCK